LLKIIKYKIQNLILFTLVLITATGYAYKYFFQEVATRHIKVDDCQISESSCSVSIDENRSLTIDILPRGMIPTKIMDINAHLKGFDVDKVLINFEGIEIDHNLPAYRFDEVSNGHFNTKGLITFCTLDSMHWWANLVIFSGNESWKVSFPFETHKAVKPAVEGPFMPIKK